MRRVFSLAGRISGGGILVSAPTYPPAFRGGGPARSVHALVTSRPVGLPVHVVTSGTDLGGVDGLVDDVNRWSERDGAMVFYGTGDPALMWAKILRSRIADTVYFNSFFSWRFTILPLFLVSVWCRPRPRIIVAPRGEFGEGALTKSSIKKRLYASVFKRFRLHRRVLWHATTEREKRDILKAMGSEVRVVVSENRTALPGLPTPPHSLADRVRFAFVSRVVEHKGAHVALASALAAAQRGVPVELAIIGPREDDVYYRDLEVMAQLSPENCTVRFEGAMPPDVLLARLRDVDVLLLPTRGENFGHVIAEALSRSCFVVTTPTTPWDTILGEGGGIITEGRTVEEWADIVGSLAPSSPGEVLGMRSEAGRAYLRYVSSAPGPHLFDLINYGSGTSSDASK